MFRIGFWMWVAVLAGGWAMTDVSADHSVVSLVLEQGGADDDVTGRADFRGGRLSQFRIRVNGGPTNENLEVFVGGISRGQFQTDRHGRGSVTFRTGPASSRWRVLDFDPRGREIEIEDAGDDSLLRHGGGGSNLVGSTVLELVNLLPTGVQPTARGKARYQERRGVRKFQVEIERAAAGTYTLMVEGVARGTFTTVLGRGKLEFASPTNDPGKLPLDFDPYGKLIQITQDDAVVLTGELRAAVPGVNVCTVGETETALVNVGPDPDASGEARLRVRENCRRDFRVEAEDLPVGDYDLYVAAVWRGTFTVTNQPSGKIEGEIEFSDPLDDDGNDWPLSFDPSGATIEVRQGPTVFLAAAAGGVNTGSCSVVTLEPDLINTGALPGAKGRARFRQEDDCDRDFRVELEDLPTGNYTLVVGGVLRGTIPVTLVNGQPKGKIVFDNEPQAGEFLYTFDPRGQLIEILQNTTVILQVTMPN